MDWFRRLPMWCLLITVMISGIVLILIYNNSSQSQKETWYFVVLHEIGFAAIIASILGFSVDFWLKSAIARDVFEATLGYILPKQFRDEVSRITSYKFVCEAHFLIVNIEIVEPGVVRVTSMSERTLKNITAYAEKYRNRVHVDEWGFRTGNSEILECTSQLQGGEPLKSEARKTDEYTVLAETNELTVEPGQLLKLCSKWVEYRRDNDVCYYHFSTPTFNPEVEIRLPEQHLDYTMGFGTPHGMLTASH
jgi:hypothetical protein